MIKVIINYNEFDDFPPHLHQYLVSVKLIESGIPLIISLTDILKQPKLDYGYLEIYENCLDKNITYCWEDDEIK